MIFFLKIEGDPVPKGRPRFTRQGRAYTPAKTANYEKDGKLLAKVKWSRQPLIDRPIACEVSARLPIPQSWTKKKKEAAKIGELRHTSRPDLDNYMKIALDILNETVITDDSIIVSLSGEKKYSEEPCLVIKLLEVSP